MNQSILDKACSKSSRIYCMVTWEAPSQGAPVMVLQPFMPTCLLGATRAASVEMSAEESFSTWTTGRPSGTNGCEYLAGAPLGTYWMVRPSARAAGDATRKSAAAAPAALEERELREGGEGERREGKEVSADRNGRRIFLVDISGFSISTFSAIGTEGSAAKTARRAVRAPRRRRNGPEIDALSRCRVDSEVFLGAHGRPRRTRGLPDGGWAGKTRPDFARERVPLLAVSPKYAGTMGATYEDFCSLAATLVALTWATARTVVLAATANIFLCDDEVGCVNGDRERNPPRKKRVRCQLTKLHKQLAGRWSTANQNSAS